MVLGPERLPAAIRSVSGWMRSIRQVSHQVKAEFSEELRVHELHQKLKQAESKGMKDLSPELQAAVDELQQAAHSVRHSYAEDTAPKPELPKSDTAAADPKEKQPE